MSYGILIAVTGPMFAGKSETIIQAITTQKILDYSIKNPMVFKHAWDMARYDADFIVSHNSRKVPCKMLDDSNLKQLANTIEQTEELIPLDWVFIDEAQFFSKEILLDTCYYLLNRGINVCCAGLNQDSFGKPFGAMGDILALAEHIITIHSKCSTCGMPATKTMRLSDSQETVLVGGNTTYEPRCRLHWK